MNTSLIKTPVLNSLVLYANSFCNAHCKMCDVGVKSSKGISRSLEKTAKYLEISLLNKILNDELISNGNLYINFLMTEPLLTPHLPELLKLCKQKGHIIKITTNGYLLKQRAAEIIDYVDVIQVSLDGTQKIHDSIRGKEFFNNAIEGIKCLRSISKEVKIEINYTITNLNYFNLSEFFMYLDSLDVFIDKMKFQLMDFVSEKMKNKHNIIFPEIRQTTSSLYDGVNINDINVTTLKNEFNKIRAYRLKNIKEVVFKPSISIPFDLQSYFCNEGNRIKGLDRCFNPWFLLAINTSGKVFWHIRCFNDYILGDITKENLRNIFYGEKANYFRLKLEESNYCFPACTRCCGVLPIG